MTRSDAEHAVPAPRTDASWGERDVSDRHVVLSEILAGEFSPWAILCANALASIVMLAILFSRHAGSIGKLTEPDDRGAHAR